MEAKKTRVDGGEEITFPTRRREQGHARPICLFFEYFLHEKSRKGEKIIIKIGKEKKQKTKNRKLGQGHENENEKEKGRLLTNSTQVGCTLPTWTRN